MTTTRLSRFEDSAVRVVRVAAGAAKGRTEADAAAGALCARVRHRVVLRVRVLAVALDVLHAAHRDAVEQLALALGHAAVHVHRLGVVGGVVTVPVSAEA